jgi:hypothetical protein
MSKRELVDPGRPPRLLTNSYEQSAGLRSAPDSAKGFVDSAQRKGMRVLCPTCKTLQGIVKCDNKIIQGTSSATYFVHLECGCPEGRVLTVNVKRKHSSTEYKVPVIETGLEGTL